MREEVDYAKHDCKTINGFTYLAKRRDYSGTNRLPRPHKGVTCCTTGGFTIAARIEDGRRNVRRFSTGPHRTDVCVGDHHVVEIGNIDLVLGPSVRRADFPETLRQAASRSER